MSNEYRFDELKLAMGILDMELTADSLKWHKESEFSVRTLLAMNDMPYSASKQGWRTWYSIIMPTTSSCSTGQTYGLGSSSCRL